MKYLLSIIIIGGMYLISPAANSTILTSNNTLIQKADCSTSCTPCKTDTPKKKVAKKNKKKQIKAKKKSKPLVEIVYVTKTIELACPVIEDKGFITPILFENEDYTNGDTPLHLHSNPLFPLDNSKPNLPYQPTFFNQSYTPNSIPFISTPISYVVIKPIYIPTNITPSSVPVPPSFILLFSSLVLFMIYRRKKAPAFTRA